MLSSIKLWAFVGLGLCIAGLLARDHIISHKLRARNAEFASVTATLNAERANRQTEIEDRKRADQSAKDLEAELAAIRAEPRITGVRICPRLPAAPAESRAAALSDDSAAERIESVPTVDPEGIDVSEGLDEYATNCAATAATLEALQAWELKRTH